MSPGLTIFLSPSPSAMIETIIFSSSFFCSESNIIGVVFHSPLPPAFPFPWGVNVWSYHEDIRFRLNYLKLETQKNRKRGVLIRVFVDPSRLKLIVVDLMQFFCCLRLRLNFFSIFHSFICFYFLLPCLTFLELD